MYPVPSVNWSNVQFVQIGGRGEFADAGQSTYRVVTASAYSGSILPMTALYPNYTYTLTFQGPRLRCGDVKDQPLFDKLRLNKSTFKTANIAYNATNPFSVLNYTQVPEENTYDIFFYTKTRNFTCETWNVTYTADFSFTNGEQSIDVTNVQYDHRFVPVKLEYYSCPYDLCGYKGWFEAVSAMFTGSAYTAGAYDNFYANTRILQTALIGCPEMSSAAELSDILGIACPGPSLEWAIETLSQNATLSFFGAVPSV
jgi:hypothetical protein